MPIILMNVQQILISLTFLFGAEALNYLAKLTICSSTNCQATFDH